MSDQNPPNQEESNVAQGLSPGGEAPQLGFEALRNAQVFNEAPPVMHNVQPCEPIEIQGAPATGDGKSKPPEAPPRINVEGKVDHSLVVIQDENGNINQTNLVNYVGLKAQDQEEIQANSKSLKELSEALPSEMLDIPEFIAAPVDEKLGDYTEQLRQNHLLCISCPDTEISLSIARAVIEKLGFESNEQKRLLNLRSHPLVASTLTIYSLAQRKANFEKPTVIVIDALSEVARTLRESLTADGVLDILNLKAGLSRQKVLLICLIDVKPTEDGSRAIGVQAFIKKLPCWRIHLFHALLKHHFPNSSSEVEEKIRRQRARYGYWGSEEDAYFEIKSLISRGSLHNVLEARDVTLEHENVEDFFKSEDTVRATALYVASFLPGLNPREFQRVVVLLLGDKTIPIKTTERQRNEKGEYEEIVVVLQKPLVEVWRQRSDILMTECQLGALVGRDGGRAVRFSREKLRDQLKTLIEDQYPFFLSDQLAQIERLGLLFDESVAISKNTTKLLVNALADDPAHGKRWLVDTLAGIEDKYADKAAASQQTGCVRSKSQGYQRIADLIRLFLSKTESAAMIADALEELMQTKQQRAVFEIVNRLRFAPHFDSFHWSKQLIERGGPMIPDLTFIQLYIHLNNIGGKIYQAITSLDTWIKKDPLPGSASRSGVYALRLLDAYCRITTNEVPAKEYGAWPSPHPLFAFSSLQAAKENLGLLARCLFHPWMSIVADETVDEDTNREATPVASENADNKTEDRADPPAQTTEEVAEEADAPDPDTLVAAFLAEWVLILMGPSDTNPAAEADPANTPTAAEVRRVLIEEFAVAAGRERGKKILTYWQNLGKAFLLLIPTLKATDEGRKHLTWRRNRLEGLITDFKGVLTTHPAINVAKTPKG